MTLARVAPFAELLAKHPRVINNNRLGEGFKGDTMTPEQHIPPRGVPGKMFEVCMTMNDTRGYKGNDRNWKSSQRLIQMLSDIASKGGTTLYVHVWNWPADGKILLISHSPQPATVTDRRYMPPARSPPPGNVIFDK